MVTDDVIKMPQTNGAQEPPVDQASASQSSAAARPFAAFRLPPFSANEAELWLTQVESACQVSGIVDDTVKFHLLAANLPLDVAAQVRDVVTAKPPSYSALKEALKDRLTQSKAVRLSELLRNQQLGDQRPTQLLLRMRSELGAAGDATQDSQLLRTLFLQRLPQSARAALSLLPEDTPLDQLATAADRFLASSTASISAVDASASAMAPYATTAYHPQSNGMVERLHRQLKAALRAAAPTQWTDALPLVLLGIRSTLKEDIGCSAAELVYGSTLRLPGELVAATTTERPPTPASFAANLQRTMQALRPAAPRGSQARPYVPRALEDASYVFVRHDAVKPPLAAPYDGPFKVIARGAKTMTVDRGSRHDVVSLDRVKPAHLEESVPTPTWPSSSRRETTDTEYTEDEELGWLLAQPETPPPAPPPAAPASILRTRAGRIPREPDRLQVGSMAAQNNDSGVAKRVRFRL